MVAEGGRPGRAELLAKKGRIVGGVGCPPNCRTSGKLRGSSDPLELFRKMLHFGKIPKKIGEIWRKFSKILAKFWKKTAKNSAIFNENFEIRERCKGVHCVDLGESFPTSIYLQNLASIQPRTSLVKFARSPRTDPLVLFWSFDLLGNIFRAACFPFETQSGSLLIELLGGRLPQSLGPVRHFLDLIFCVSVVFQSHFSGSCSSFSRFLSGLVLVFIHADLVLATCS